MRAVIDTNVVFEGLTKSGSASDEIMLAWKDKLFVPCYSIPLAYEYKDVLGRKLSEKKWGRIEPVVNELLTIALPVAINFRWRPISPDPDDDFVIDCALNANAIVVTYNSKDFRIAADDYGLNVMKPHQFLTELFL